MQKKDVMKSSWSVDSFLLTPFARNVMSCSEFHNIPLFLHCCSNTKYPSKAQPDYDPRIKLGKVLTVLQEWFAHVWIPKQHLSIEEETVPFKGQIHVKVYNLNKPDKHGIKKFKLCDFSRSHFMGVQLSG